MSGARLTHWASLLGPLLLACATTKHPARAVPPAARFGPLERPSASPLFGPHAANTALLAVEAGVAGDRISGLLEIPNDECAILIARAGPSVEDVDLFAYGEDGSVVGSDEGPDKTPALLVCPPHPPRVWVAARIAAGHGLVAVGAQRVARADAQRAAAAYGLHADPDLSEARVRAWPGLDERLAVHRREMGGDWQDVRRVAVPLDARMPTRISAQVDAGRCLDAFLAPADDAGHLELSAVDAQGAILGRATNSGRERSLVVCSPLETSVAFELRPQSGRGVGVLVLSRTRPGSEVDLDTEVSRIAIFPSSALDQESRQFEATLAAQNGYPPGKTLSSGMLESGRRSSLPITLKAGCSRLDVIGGDPLRGLEAWAYASNDELLSHAQGGARATLFACGPGGSLRLDIEATLRPGPYAVLLHSEAEVPEALLHAPLAAGRLLAHVVAHGVLRRPSELGQALEMTLSESALKTIDLTVPFGRCVDVALALGADTLGAEIRLVALRTGAEIAVARGAHATSARVCALEGSSADDNLKTRAELRVGVGSGKALVATRMLNPTR